VKVYPFIAAEKPAERNVIRSCALLSVSRSAYYDWSKHIPSGHARDDERLRSQIRRIHGESRGTYGAPRVHQQLLLEGVHTGRKRVARVMAEDGLQGRQKRRFKKTTIPDAEAADLWTDLVARDFSTADRPLNQVWAGDITYIRTWQGWAYLATVIDLASRRVVGFAVADHMRTSLIQQAMEMALTSRRPGPGLIFHSDRGSQYTSTAFRDLLARQQVRQSLSRPRQCWDNAVAESFFATLKTELVYRQALATVPAARSAVFEYIEVFYNRKRIHSALGYQSPSTYEACRLTQSETAPAA
jgi:transposase InsO family protein